MLADMLQLPEWSQVQMLAQLLHCLIMVLYLFSHNTMNAV